MADIICTFPGLYIVHFYQHLAQKIQEYVLFMSEIYVGIATFLQTPATLLTRHILA